MMDCTNVGVDPLSWRGLIRYQAAVSLTPLIDRDQRWKIGFVIGFDLQRQTLLAFG
jgi:hypothetical protein